MRCTGVAVDQAERRAQRFVARARCGPAPRAARGVRASPRSRTANGMWYVSLTPSICAKNHSRCCANDIGMCSPRSAGDDAAAAPRAPRLPADRARSLSTGRANRSRTATLHAGTPRACAVTARTASSECPPSWKKWSWRPTRSTLSSFAQIAGDRRFDLALRRFVRRARVRRRVRRRQRAAIDLAVGRERHRLQRMNAAGIMYSGKRDARCSRSSSALSSSPSAGDVVRDEALLAVVVAHDDRRLARRARAPSAPPRSRPARCGTRAASPDRRCARRTRSCRPASRRTRSPVLYSRSPSTNGLAMKRSAVSSGRLR